MQQKQLKPGDYMAIFRRRRLALIVPCVVVVLVAVIVAVSLPPVYRSSSTILIEDQDIPDEFVKSTVNVYAEQQLQVIGQRIMTSTRLLEIINRFDLAADRRDRVGTEVLVAGMREAVSLEPISVEVIDRRTGRPTAATIAFTVSYEGTESPQKVQQVAGVLASLILEENLRDRARQASEISRFLEDEMYKVRGELGGLDENIAGFKEIHVNELPELLQVNMQTLNNLEQRCTRLRDQRTHLREKVGALETQLAGIPSDGEQDQRRRLEELRLQLVTLKNRCSEDHPDVIRTRREIKDLEVALAGDDSGAAGRVPTSPAYLTVSSQLSGTRSEIDSLSQQIREMEREMEAYRARIEATPRVEAQYNALLIERRNTQAKHDDLMHKFMEARVSEGLEQEQKGQRFTMLEPARLPEAPCKPNRRAIVLIGLVLGLGAGVGCAALREYADTTVHDALQLAEVTGCRVLATIPRIVTEEDLEKGKRRRSARIGAACAAVLVVLVTVHFQVMNLDVLMTRALQHLF